MKGAGGARLFAALDLPPDVCEELASWGRAASRTLGGHGSAAPAVRLLGLDDLHLTLCFLGLRPFSEIAALSLAVRSLAPRPLELAAGPPVMLPRRHPRALAVVIADPEGEVARLQALLTGELRRASGWEPSRGRFTPHITVARMRGAPLDPGTLPPTPQLRFSAQAVVLYRSFLEPSGARYEALASCELPPL
jgi:2'-5' RNA ligase